MNCLQCEIYDFDSGYIYCPFCGEELLTDEQIEIEKAENDILFKADEKRKYH